MNDPSDRVLETVVVREIAAVFRDRDALDRAVEALLNAGFDRSQIDLMAGLDAIRKRLGDVYLSAKELPDVPSVPRRAYIAKQDTANALPLVAGVLSFVGAATAALGVVASGGALAVALAAAAAGGALGGGAGAMITRLLGRELAEELQSQMETGGLVLWVRIRSPEDEEKARQILSEHGGEYIRVHDIEIEKRLEDIPLSSLVPDPLLGERLGDPV